MKYLYDIVWPSLNLPCQKIDSEVTTQHPQVAGRGMPAASPGDGMLIHPGWGDDPQASDMGSGGTPKTLDGFC